MITRYFKFHANPGVDPVGENLFASNYRLKSLAKFIRSDPIKGINELFCAAVMGLHEAWLDLPEDRRNVMHFREPLRKTMHSIIFSFETLTADIKGICSSYCQLVTRYPDT